MAEDDSLRRVPAALGIVEEAAGQWLHTKYVKEVLRHRNAGEPLRFARAGEADVTRSIEWKHTSDGRPRVVLFAEREQVVHLHRLGRKIFGRAVGEPGEPFRPVEWKWTQQQCATETEHGGTRADADGDDGDGEDRGADVTSDGPGGEADVLRESVGECHGS